MEHRVARSTLHVDLFCHPTHLYRQAIAGAIARGLGLEVELNGAMRVIRSTCRYITIFYIVVLSYLPPVHVHIGSKATLRATGTTCTY